MRLVSANGNRETETEKQRKHALISNENWYTKCLPGDCPSFKITAAVFTSNF